MANPIDENPVLAAVIDELLDRADDVDVIQGQLDLVRAAIAENDALYGEAATQLVEAHMRFTEAQAAAAVVRRQMPGSEEEVLLVDPEVAARWAVVVEAAANCERVRQHRVLLFEAVLFLVLVRAAAFAVARAHLLPGVLLTAAAAYVIAYAASWGAVVPGLTSLLRISVLVLCFLFGVPVVGDLA